MSDLMLAVEEIREHLPEHLRSESYYEGDQPEVIASSRMRRALGADGSSQFRLNFARTVVTSVLDRMSITAVTSPDDTTSEMIQRILEYNEFEDESEETHRWSLTYGEGYIIAWPNETEDDVDLFFNSPKTTRIFYDPENPRRKKFGAKMWVEGPKKNRRCRVNLYYADRIEKYVSPKEEPKTVGDFSPFVDMFETVVQSDEDGNEYEEQVEVWPLPNPYDEVPVFHFRTQRPYGRPEHKDAFSPQDMVNKLVITQMAVNDFHGFPQRYVLAGHNTSEDFDDFDVTDEEIQERESEASEGLTSGPGELWWLTGDNLKVGQFSAADVKVFLEPLREYVKAMAALTQTPVHNFEGMGDPPSGESLRVSEAPLIKKIKDRIQSFTSTWVEVIKFALKVLGQDDAEVNINWAPPESHDDKDTWETAKSKREAGVPMKRVLMEAGYSEEDATSFAEEAQGSDPAVTIALEMLSSAPSLASSPGLTELITQIRAAMEPETEGAAA